MPQATYNTTLSTLQRHSYPLHDPFPAPRLFVRKSLASNPVLFSAADMFDVDWKGLALPFAYLLVLSGALMTFSTIYRKRRAGMDRNPPFSLRPTRAQHSH